MAYSAHGKAWDAETKSHCKDVCVKFETRRAALNWCRFNREWMTDLRVDDEQVSA